MSVAANVNHTMFLTTAGDIYGAGRNGCERPLIAATLPATVAGFPWQRASARENIVSIALPQTPFLAPLPKTMSWALAPRM
jgi:hypothetical protein